MAWTDRIKEAAYTSPSGTRIVFNGYEDLSKSIEKNKRRMELFNRGLKKLKSEGAIERYFEESRRGEYFPR